MSEIEVDASGVWVGSSLGFSWHCSCGWVSRRYETDSEAVDAEVWPHMVEKHPARARTQRLPGHMGDHMASINGPSWSREVDGRRCLTCEELVNDMGLHFTDRQRLVHRVASCEEQLERASMAAENWSHRLAVARDALDTYDEETRRLNDGG